MLDLKSARRIHRVWIFHLCLECVILASHLDRIDQSYRVKPHEHLVSVSLTHYCSSTPDLSTSWSRTSLQVAQGPGRAHLGTSFPLRCFQRLSLPHLATRQCHWRDNRYTRGASTPVLLYLEQASSSLQRPRKIWTKLSHDVLNPAHVPL